MQNSFDETRRRIYQANYQMAYQTAYQNNSQSTLQNTLQSNKNSLPIKQFSPDLQPTEDKEVDKLTASLSKVHLNDSLTELLSKIYKVEPNLVVNCILHDTDSSQCILKFNKKHEKAFLHAFTLINQYNTTLCALRSESNYYDCTYMLRML